MGNKRPNQSGLVQNQKIKRHNLRGQIKQEEEDLLLESTKDLPRLVDLYMVKMASNKKNDPRVGSLLFKWLMYKEGGGTNNPLEMDE